MLDAALLHDAAGLVADEGFAALDDAAGRTERGEVAGSIASFAPPPPCAMPE
jgi:hypothetical protein